MKIISRTRKISVSGVMLISQNIPPPPDGALIAISALSPQRRVDQARRANMDGRVNPFDLLRKVVVEDHGDNRDRKAQRGRDQSFRNTGRDDRKSSSAHDRHRLKRRQDADDGAEQADKWRRRAGSG